MEFRVFTSTNQKSVRMPNVYDLEMKLEKLESKLVYDKKRIFKNAYHRQGFGSFSDALKEAWAVAKAYRVQILNEINDTLKQIAKCYEVRTTDNFASKQMNKDLQEIAAKGGVIY